MNMPGEAYRELRDLIVKHARPHLYPERVGDGRWTMAEARSILEMWGDYNARGKAGEGADGAELRFALINSVPTSLVGPWYEDHVFPDRLSPKDIDEGLNAVMADVLRFIVPENWDGDLGGQQAHVTQCYERDPGFQFVVLTTADGSSIEVPVKELTESWTPEIGLDYAPGPAR